MADFLWCLFCPFALYCIRLLPVIKPVDGETVERFAQRTQQMMAHALSLQATRLQLITPNRTQRLDPRLAGMIKQVKEVLPHVPADVVQRDLQRTRCVDTTISNIMEGTIQFTPEPVPVPVQHSTSIKSSASDKGSRQSEQGQTVSDHTLSFSERKKAFIEEARRLVWH
jgi:ancient ubiquitous protein 1